jgi:protoporphyrinogen oxidase
VIHYPASGGIDHISVKISDSLTRSGGKVLLNAEAVSVEHREKGVSVTLKKDGQVDEMDGDFLISTIPITHLTRMLSPVIPTEIAEKANLLRYRTLLLLYLAVKKDWLLKNQCIYFTEDSFIFRRITEFKHLSEGMVPHRKTSLCIEMTCFEDDEIFAQGDREIVSLVVKQLEKYGYLKPGDVEDSHVLRIPFSYPVYEIAYNGILEALLHRLAKYENLISIGRQGLFFYNAMNSSILLSTELGTKLASCSGAFGRVIEETYQRRTEKYIA